MTGTTKSLTTLNKLVREVLVSSKVEKKQITAIMSALTERATELSALFVTSVPARKRKDPNAPKKNSSNYIHFCNDVRESFKKKNPTMVNTELSALIGAEWNRVKNDPAVVKKYSELARKDKERYEHEMTSYTAPTQESLAEASRARQASRSKNGYNIFCEETRPAVKSAHPEMSSNAILTELGNRWTALSATEKAVFNTRAKASSAPASAPAKASSSSSALPSVPESKPAPAKRVQASKKSAPVESDDEPLVDETPAPAKKASGKAPARRS
jgi:hypothetical protein